MNNGQNQKLHVTNPSTVQRVQYTIFTRFRFNPVTSNGTALLFTKALHKDIQFTSLNRNQYLKKIGKNKRKYAYKSA